MADLFYSEQKILSKEKRKKNKKEPSRILKFSFLKDSLLKFWLELVIKKKFLDFVEIYLNNDCNLKCGYCFQYDNTPKKRLELIKAKEIISWLRKKGYRIIGILGGEPLLSGDNLLKIVRYAHDLGFYVYISTNARLLTREYVKDLKEAGVRMLDIAVDTVYPHDYLEKNLMAISEKIDLLLNFRELKFQFKANTVLTKKNIEDIKFLVSYFTKLRIPISIHIIEGPIVKEYAPEYENKLKRDLFFDKDKKEDIEMLENFISWIIEEKKKNFFIINPKEYFLNIKNYVLKQPTEWKCLAGTNSFCVRTDGKLSLCSALYNFILEKDSTNLEKILEIKQKCNPYCLSCTKFLQSYYKSSSFKLLKEYLRVFH